MDCCWAGCMSVAVVERGRVRTTCAADSSRLPPDVRDASTQVSFDPPPWLELTTSDPSGSATRVRPPGSTHTDSPSLTANGRKSTCRGERTSPILVGTVDSCTTGWATQPRGSAVIFLRIAASSRSVASGPNTMP